MPRGEGAPVSVIAPDREEGVPKREIIHRRRNFYYGENDVPIRDPAAEAETDWRLYTHFRETHTVRMPYFPRPARRLRRP
ncbi:hypothetical protein KBC70_01255 [Candidatus Woesebacteria bacterium]|nr:hypothetical protein [Candidatus Woesebacteria bacterium]